MSAVADMKALFELGIIPAGGEGLYQAAVDNSGLTLSDYQTIRDLAQAGGLFDNVPVHCLLVGLFQAAADGSPCLDLNPEQWTRMGWLAQKAGDAKAIEGVAGKLKKCGLLEETGKETFRDIPAVPLLIQKNRDKNRRFIYFQRYYAAEKTVRDNLLALMNSRQLKAFGNRGAGEIKGAVVEVCGQLSKPIDPLQLAAVTACLYKNFVVISGGPGTGKTTSAAAVLQAMVRLGLTSDKILLAAPTGRAAQRLKESIQRELTRDNEQPSEFLPQVDQALLKGLESKTLHRALNFSPYHNRFFYSAQRPLPHQVILVDEVSMVDIFMMGALLEAVGEGARVIFMGDKDQLPSVDAGAVLEDLAPRGLEPCFSADLKTRYKDIAAAVKLKEKAELAESGAEKKGSKDARLDRIVILQTSHRSVKNILELANGINEFREGDNLCGELPVLQGEKIDWPGALQKPVKPLCLLKETRDRDRWQGQLESWAAKHCGLEKDGPYRNLLKAFDEADDAGLNTALNELFQLTGAARVLTFVHPGLEGERWINRTLGRYIRGKLDKTRNSDLVFNGAAVLITQNDYHSRLFNGDTGVILRRRGEYRAWFRIEGGYQDFPLKALPAWSPAWAITVHKSQGSEYDHILLVLPESQDHRMLTREILYTGITRAKYTAVIRGSADAIHKGAGRSIDRESGIELW